VQRAQPSIESQIQPTPSPLFAPIPRGVADVFWHDAWQRRQLETRLLELFRSWGYGDVIPPLLEYAETIVAHSTPQVQAEMLRFLDRDGSMLALRSDMTIGVARLVGTRLRDWPMPQRFCYAGSVFRHNAPQAGQQREFAQAGVELIGAAAPAADAEVLALTAAALAQAGLKGIRLAVGHLGYFHGLLQELHLDAAERARLLAAIDRNSDNDLAEFLDQATLNNAQRRTIEQLPQLSGNDTQAILAHADELCLNEAMHFALANLRAILTAHDAFSASETIYLDLTEIHNLGYYTGLTFEALAPQIGFPVASGGRYDQLVGAFGQGQPAVGVALSLDRILLARTLAEHGKSRRSPKPLAPHILMATHRSPRALAVVRQLRQTGLRVEVDVTGRTVDELQHYARHVGVTLLLVWQQDGFTLYDTGAADDLAGGRHMSIDECLNWAAKQLAAQGDA
jgi:ATP phosphoribosyltransferase regulatory subunit